MRMEMATTTMDSSSNRDQPQSNQRTAIDDDEVRSTFLHETHNCSLALVTKYFRQTQYSTIKKVGDALIVIKNDPKVLHRISGPIFEWLLNVLTKSAGEYSTTNSFVDSILCSQNAWTLLLAILDSFYSIMPSTSHTVTSSPAKKIRLAARHQLSNAKIPALYPLFNVIFANVEKIIDIDSQSTLLSDIVKAFAIISTDHETLLRTKIEHLCDAIGSLDISLSLDTVSSQKYYRDCLLELLARVCEQLFTMLRLITNDKKLFTVFVSKFLCSVMSIITTLTQIQMQYPLQSLIDIKKRLESLVAFGALSPNVWGELRQLLKRIGSVAIEDNADAIDLKRDNYTRLLFETVDAEIIKNNTRGAEWLPNFYNLYLKRASVRYREDDELRKNTAIIDFGMLTFFLDSIKKTLLTDKQTYHRWLNCMALLHSLSLEYSVYSATNDKISILQLRYLMNEAKITVEATAKIVSAKPIVDNDLSAVLSATFQLLKYDFQIVQQNNEDVLKILLTTPGSCRNLKESILIYLFKIHVKAKMPKKLIDTIFVLLEDSQLLYDHNTTYLLNDSRFYSSLTVALSGIIPGHALNIIKTIGSSISVNWEEMKYERFKSIIPHINVICALIGNLRITPGIEPEFHTQACSMFLKDIILPSIARIYTDVTSKNDVKPRKKSKQSHAIGIHKRDVLVDVVSNIINPVMQSHACLLDRSSKYVEEFRSIHGRSKLTEQLNMIKTTFDKQIADCDVQDNAYYRMLLSAIVNEDYLCNDTEMPSKCIAEIVSQLLKHGSSILDTVLLPTVQGNLVDKDHLELNATFIAGLISCHNIVLRILQEQPRLYETYADILLKTLFLMPDFTAPIEILERDELRLCIIPAFIKLVQALFSALKEGARSQNGVDIVFKTLESMQPNNINLSQLSKCVITLRNVPHKERSLSSKASRIMSDAIRLLRYVPFSVASADEAIILLTFVAILSNCLDQNSFSIDSMSILRVSLFQLVQRAARNIGVFNANLLPILHCFENSVDNDVLLHQFFVSIWERLSQLTSDSLFLQLEYTENNEKLVKEIDAPTYITSFLDYLMQDISKGDSLCMEHSIFFKTLCKKMENRHQQLSSNSPLPFVCLLKSVQKSFLKYVTSLEEHLSKCLTNIENKQVLPKYFLATFSAVWQYHLKLISVCDLNTLKTFAFWDVKSLFGDVERVKNAVLIQQRPLEYLTVASIYGRLLSDIVNELGNPYIQNIFNESPISIATKLSNQAISQLQFVEMYQNSDDKHQVANLCKDILGQMLRIVDESSCNNFIVGILNSAAKAGPVTLLSLSKYVAKVFPTKCATGRSTIVSTILESIAGNITEATFFDIDLARSAITACTEIIDNRSLRLRLGDVQTILTIADELLFSTKLGYAANKAFIYPYGKDNRNKSPPTYGQLIKQFSVYREMVTCLFNETYTLLHALANHYRALLLKAGPMFVNCLEGMLFAFNSKELSVSHSWSTCNAEDTISIDKLEKDFENNILRFAGPLDSECAKTFGRLLSVMGHVPSEDRSGSSKKRRRDGDVVPDAIVSAETMGHLVTLKSRLVAPFSVYVPFFIARLMIMLPTLSRERVYDLKRALFVLLGLAGERRRNFLLGMFVDDDGRAAVLRSWYAEWDETFRFKGEI